MSGKAARVTLTETMYDILERLANSGMTPQSIAVRMMVILLAWGKSSNIEISQPVGIGRQQVGLWRRRWKESQEALLAIQFIESTAQFERAIMSVFCDAQRSGSPGKFTPTQVVGIISIACEPPSHCDRPVTTWTGRELADEAVKRGLVDSISTSQVNRFLAARKLEIDEQTLEQAKKWGVLKTMQTRRAFLSDPTHPIRFVYLPKHRWWLNQVEFIFGIISRRVMRGGSFTSQGDLTQKIQAFINYFNRTFAKPMNWTYNGRPTRKKRSDRKPGAKTGNPGPLHKKSLWRQVYSDLRH